MVVAASNSVKIAKGGGSSDNIGARCQIDISIDDVNFIRLPNGDHQAIVYISYGIAAQGSATVLGTDTIVSITGTGNDNIQFYNAITSVGNSMYGNLSSNSSIEFTVANGSRIENINISIRIESTAFVGVIGGVSSGRAIGTLNYTINFSYISPDKTIALVAGNGVLNDGKFFLVLPRAGSIQNGSQIIIKNNNNSKSIWIFSDDDRFIDLDKKGLYFSDASGCLTLLTYDSNWWILNYFEV